MVNGNVNTHTVDGIDLAPADRWFIPLINIVCRGSTIVLVVPDLQNRLS